MKTNNELKDSYKPAIPDIQGIEVMSLLEMNSIRFNKRHTLITPETIEQETKIKK